jgi:two-component system cell cycle response regulator DivK
MTRLDRSPLVLVVEDYADAREMYAAYIRLAGFSVAEAGDGVEAIRLAAELEPDVVVLDLSLPRLDGWGVIRRLRSDPRTRAILIVALSGHSRARVVEDAGWDAFVLKPCMQEELIGEIRRVLERRQRTSNS